MKIRLLIMVQLVCNVFAFQQEQTPLIFQALDEIDVFLLDKKIPTEVKQQYFPAVLDFVKNIESEIKEIKIALPIIKHGYPQTFVPFNPSIMKTKEGYDVICRTANTLHVPYYKRILKQTRPQNRNFFLKFDKSFQLLKQEEILNITDSGFEDCRLFSWLDDYWFSCALTIKKKKYFAKFALAVFQQENENSASKTVKKLTVFNGPYTGRQEKNWLHVIEDNTLKLIYSYDPFIVLEPLVEKKSYKTVINRSAPLDFSRFRGSAAPIPFEDGYLLMIHEVIMRNGVRNYLHRFLFMNKGYEITKLSRPFTFTHIGIEYCLSMAWDHSNEHIIMPIGVDDKEAKFCIVKSSTIANMLHTIAPVE